MPFEKFIPPKSTTEKPRATIRPSGLVSFDAAAVDAFNLDTFSHAILFFDKSRKLLGVQPSNKEGDAGAFKLSKRRRSVSLKAPQFFEIYGLNIEEPTRFDVDRDSKGEMLTLDLKDVPRRRGRRPKSV